MTQGVCVGERGTGESEINGGAGSCCTVDPDAVAVSGNNMFDGVAKTHQLLRCCNCSRCFDVRKYASLLDNRAPCIWRFLLSHRHWCFFEKASPL